ETAYIEHIQIKAGDLFEILDLFEAYQHCIYTMAWIDCLKQGKHFGRSIMMMGEPANPDQLTKYQSPQPLLTHPSDHISFPVNMPSFILNPFTMKAFNELFYLKNIKKHLHTV